MQNKNMIHLKLQIILLFQKPYQYEINFFHMDKASEKKKNIYNFK